MASKTSFVRLLLLTFFIVGAGSAAAQDELRKTFFKDVDAALAAADEVQARLYGPAAYADGAEDYEAAEVGVLTRIAGRLPRRSILNSNR